MKVAILRAARLDIQKCAQFWERQEPGLGIEFIEYILSELDEVATLAGIHPKKGSYHRAVLEGRFPYYAVYYRIIEDIAEIVAIVDTRRDPKRIDNFLKRRLQ